MMFRQSRLKKFHVPQMGEYACGLACLSALASYYGGPISQERLRQMSGTTLNGTTLLGLCQAAQSIGFDAKGYEGDIERLKTWDHPSILHTIINTNRQHYIICYGFENGKFIVGDPGWGITYYSENELESIWQSKALLSIKPNENFQTQRQSQQSQWQWFMSLIKDDIPVLTVAAVMGVLMAITGLAPAVFSQKLIDDFLPRSDIQNIIWGLVALGLLLCIRAFLGYLQGILMASQGKGLNVRIVKSFIEKIIRLPISYFRGYSTGDLIARMNDSMRIRNTVSLFTGGVAINVLVVIISTGYIFLQSVSMGLLSVSGVLFFIMVAWRFNAPIYKLQKEVMATHSLNESQYIDALTGIDTIKSFGKEEVFKDRINTIYDLYQTKGYDLAILGNRFGFFTQLMVGIYLSLMFSYGVWMVLNEQLLLGELIALITVGNTIIPSIAGLMMANIQFQEAKVAFKRLFEISSVEKEYEGEENKVPKTPIKKNDVPNEMVVRDLSFRFPGKSKILKEVGLEIKTGEIISVFGQVGSGKSTLVDLMQGFYLPEKGLLKINGKDLNEWTRPVWRSKIAVVAQSEKIFNSTILDNICLSNDPDELQRCLDFVQSSGLMPLYAQFPQGVLTICEEEGKGLSGGQRQLVAIARALYKQPDFLLLDESTSAMDFETEAVVLKVLRIHSRTMGIILITHRIGLARQTDRILVLKDGRIAHKGRHEELVLGQNEYARAFEHLTLVNSFK